MNEDKDSPVLRLVQKEVDKRTASERKADYYKKRSNKQKDFYANARIATVSIQLLKEALLTSVVLDDQSQVIVEWNAALVEELLKDIKDPGPIRKRVESNEVKYVKPVNKPVNKPDDKSDDLLDDPAVKQWIKKHRGKWQKQKENAQVRDIDFKLTWVEWIDWWINTGKLDQRGHKKGQYVMARINDQGPYKLGNIKCITVTENQNEAHLGRRKDD